MAKGFEVVRQWLRQWWYGTRQQVSEVVRPKVSPKRPTPKPLHMHQTAADGLDWLCYRLHVQEYKILRLNDAVVVLLVMPDMSVHSSGLASSTALAVAKLIDKFKDQL